MINFPLLQKVMDHIDAHQEAWDQGNWRAMVGPHRLDQDEELSRCGTAMCFAGWTAELSDDATWTVSAPEVLGGWNYMKDDRDLESVWVSKEVLDTMASCILQGPWLKYAIDHEESGQYPIHVRVFAEWKLGLGHVQASELFNGSNSLSRLHELVGELVKEGESQL